MIIAALLFCLFAGTACSSDEGEAQQEVNPNASTDDDDSDDSGDDDSDDSDSGSSSGDSFVEEDDDDSEDVTGVFDYSTLTALGHPRLLMTEDDFTDLTSKVTTSLRYSNKTLYKMHKLVIALADEYAAQTNSVTYTFDSSNKRILEQSRIALRRLFACSYAYRLTGTEKYLTRAVSDLETVCKFSDWNASKHFLDVGEMALGVAIAYDWLYYDLSYTDRVLAHQAMVDYALTPSTSHSFHNYMNNWNQVCNAGVVAAAIALYEKDKSISAQVIEKALQSNDAAMAFIYYPDGNYPEGYDYWGYGTGFEVILLQMLETAFGSMNSLDKNIGFSETAEYMLYMAGANGEVFPYADGGTSTEKPMLGMWWFAAKNSDPALLLNEWRLYDNGDYSDPDDDSNRLMPMVPCFLQKMDDSSALDDVSASTPSSNFWYGEGDTPVAMVHTGWNYDESDFYVGIKGGYAATNHGHQDAGSFVFDAYGVRWSSDLIRQSYTTVENALSSAGGNYSTMTQTSLRWDIYRQNNLAHSTISFETNDGSVTKVHDTDHLVDGVASIAATYDGSDGYYGAKLDMSEVVADAVASAYRTVKLEASTGDLYIIDEITAQSGFDAPMQWRMMTPATVTVSDGAITLTKSSQTMYLTASNESSVDITYTSWSASRPDEWTSRTWDLSNTGYTVAGYTATIPAGKTVTFTTKLSATN